MLVGKKAEIQTYDALGSRWSEPACEEVQLEVVLAMELLARDPGETMQVHPDSLVASCFLMDGKSFGEKRTDSAVEELVEVGFGVPLVVRLRLVHIFRSEVAAKFLLVEHYMATVLEVACIAAEEEEAEQHVAAAHTRGRKKTVAVRLADAVRWVSEA